MNTKIWVQEIWKKNQSQARFFTGLLSFSALSAGAQPDWDRVYKSANMKVPVIFSSGMVCSGILVDQKLILTASHCVDGLRQIYVYFRGQFQEKIEAEVVRMSRAEDLALIQLKQEVDYPPLTFMSEKQKLTEGQAVATIGHPVTLSQFKAESILGSEYTHVISSGIVSRMSAQGFVSDMSVSPGNSGGPVFNEKGEVVGVVSKKRIDRFVGDLGYFSSHQQALAFIQDFRKQGPRKISIREASSQAHVYLLYSAPSYRKDRDGDAKSYYNLGLAVDMWDRLRLFIDTNLDTKEAFTQYGIGWNFYIQASDPVQSYRIIPTVETLKFRYRIDDHEVEKHGVGLGLMLKASWFPFFLKGSTFQVNEKAYSLVGIGLGF